MGAGGVPGEVGIEPGVPTAAGGCGLLEGKARGDIEGKACGGTGAAGRAGEGEERGEVGVIGRGRGGARGWVVDG